MGELCPACGQFVDDMRASTGWCGSCTAREQWRRREPAPPLVPVWKNCKYCGMRYPFQTTSLTVKKWGTCAKCLVIVRRRARMGQPPLQPSGRCEHCHREFDFPVGAGPRMYCPACQPWFRKQRAAKAGRSSGHVPKPRRPDGSYGDVGHAYRGHGDDGRFTRKGAA